MRHYPTVSNRLKQITKEFSKMYTNLYFIDFDVITIKLGGSGDTKQEVVDSKIDVKTSIPSHVNTIQLSKGLYEAIFSCAICSLTKLCCTSFHFILVGSFYSCAHLLSFSFLFTSYCIAFIVEFSIVFVVICFSFFFF